MRTPRSLEEALREMHESPDAVPLLGGTDLMVALNRGRLRPRVVVNLWEVPELRGWGWEGSTLRLGAAVTHAQVIAELAAVVPALAEAARTIGSPQIANRGTLGGNLGTASPAGDALPPLLMERAEVELASVRGARTMPLEQFLTGPKRTAIEHGELITAIRLTPSRGRQTFMKLGPRNAMVIAVCSLAVVVDRERDEVRAAFGSCAPTARSVRVPLADAGASLAELILAEASPIDDHRASADYRRHALQVLTRRALARCAP